jgi:ATP phosphoribosyltransferase
LADRSLALLERAGLRPESRAEGALAANLGSGFQGIFVRAQDIPEFVADRAAEVGITGSDLVAEAGRDVEDLLDLQFGRCRLVVAVKEDSSVQSLEGIEPGTRIATAFPRATEMFFRNAGIPITVARVSGAAEIAPHLGVAEVIVDLVSTGSTLRVNRLREIGTILESTAHLIANRKALADPERGEAVTELVAGLESVLLARQKRYLMANVPQAKLEEVKEVIPGLTGPTIVEIRNGNGWVAAHAVVDTDRIYRTITRLKALGAEGILVTPIERLMP